MDGVSSAVTVLEVLKLAWEVIGYIKAVKGADEERRKLSLELTRATGLLATVTDIAEEVKDDWARAIRALEGPAGALVAFYALLGERTACIDLPLGILETRDLAANTVQLENCLIRGASVFVVAIYCAYGNRPQNRSLQSVLAFIVQNMLATDKRFQKCYNKLMLTGEGPLKVANSLRFIHRARQDFDRFYVLLDGLDEDSPQQAQELVDKLTSLHVPLTLFVTSRPNSVVMGSFFHHSINIEEVPRALFLSSFVRSKLNDALWASTVQEDVTMLDRAADVVSKGANASFFWANLVVELLLTAETPEDFSKLLERVQTEGSEEIVKINGLHDRALRAL